MAACQPKTRRSSSPGTCLLAVLVFIAMTAGCAATRCAPGHAQVSFDLDSRVGHGLHPNPCGNTSIPNDINLADGVTTDEAVAVALWNNAAFNATLTRLGMARGDLLQAGLLRNPQFQVFLPGGSKQLEWALFLPLDALLLRETRLDLSEREVCRIAEELTQNGVDLVRDVRVAHADLVFAVEQSALADEAVALREDIYDLTRKQLQAGDISELESTTAQIALKQAQAEAAGLKHGVAQAESRLKQLMSIGMMPITLSPQSEATSIVLTHELDDLIAEAATSRPDLRAASFAYESAKKRADLSRWQWLRFDVVADANSGGVGNSNFGSGFRFDVPIFDRNQGGIQTADWSVTQARHNYNAVRDQVVADVQASYAQYWQAEENLNLLRSDVLTSLEEAVRLAGRAFANGGASYFVVLQTSTQYLDARVREIQLSADLQRAAANLDRSVGRNVTTQPRQPTLDNGTPFADVVEPAGFSENAPTADEPNILILSKDGTALFNGSGNRKEVGAALRRIAGQLEKMSEEDRLTGNHANDLRNAINVGWQE